MDEPTSSGTDTNTGPGRPVVLARNALVATDVATLGECKHPHQRVSGRRTSRARHPADVPSWSAPRPYARSGTSPLTTMTGTSSEDADATAVRVLVTPGPEV